MPEKLAARTCRKWVADIDQLLLRKIARVEPGRSFMVRGAHSRLRNGELNDRNDRDWPNQDQNTLLFRNLQLLAFESEHSSHLSSTLHFNAAHNRIFYNIRLSTNGLRFWLQAVITQCKQTLSEQNKHGQNQYISPMFLPPKVKMLAKHSGACSGLLRDSH